ncbi:MAG TPA: M56 family metallopeptidase [Anaerovoracaceae bacterium]|nr:M56 family metallopeptidase [Anaerovoracaceae bacterium]
MNDLFLSVLNMSMTASYVIAAIMLARLFLKKAPKAFSYALWAAAGFRLVFPFSFESVFSLIPFKAQPASNIVSNYTGEPIRHIIISPDWAPPAETGTISNAMLLTPAEVPTYFWFRLAGEIWLIGIMAMLIYSIASVILLKRRLREAAPAGGRVLEADNLKTPFVLGLFRPKIYIPSGLSREEKNYVILHEQTHIKRLDHIIKPAAFLILCVHWFNPVVWLAFLQMSADMEMSCDERVLKEMGSDIKKAYSTSLLSLAAGRSLINGGPLAFGEGNIKGRIRNVLNYRKPTFWILIAAVIAVIAIGTGLLANPISSTDSANTPNAAGDEWQPQPKIENQDDYDKAVDAALQSVKYEEIAVDDMGSYEETAQAWMDAWFAMFKALPEDNMAHIADSAVDRLRITQVSKPGLPQAFIFSVTLSVRPTYSIGSNAFWMAGNTGNSPGRDETWGQMSREVELRIGDDGRYYYVSMGTGGAGNSDEYIPVEIPKGIIPDGISVPEEVLSAAKDYVVRQYQYWNSSTGVYTRSDGEEHMVGEPASFDNWRIEGLSPVYSYKEIDGQPVNAYRLISGENWQSLEVYRLDFRIHTTTPEKVILAGGMDLDGENWLLPTYPDSTYLFFSLSGNDYIYLFTMMENDCAPGDELFTSDLKARLTSQN